jgi:hypothetical protein
MRTHKRKIDRITEIKYLVIPLSQELLAINFIDGDTIKVNVSEKVGLVFGK